MDDLDRRLLALLAEDARQGVTQLARRLGVARTTAQARLDRLEREKVIAGYALKLSPEARAGEIEATVLLQIEPRAGPAVLQRLRAMPQVRRAHTTSGRFDLILLMVARRMEELDTALDEIGAIRGVRSSESLIHLSSKIDRG